MVRSVLKMNGFEVLRFNFRGTSAHAGAHPHLGKNAQNAAALFLQACAFLREEFPEERHIRIHPVLHLKAEQALNFAVDPDLHDLLRDCAAEEGVEFAEEEFSAASSDMGDVSQIKPSIIIGLPGTNGRFHSPEFRVVDEQAAYVFPSEFPS
jgi:metal-dependent amidase/aminoacylase/carboxypeptidase family protein